MQRDVHATDAVEPTASPLAVPHSRRRFLAWAVTAAATGLASGGLGLWGWYIFRPRRVETLVLATARAEGQYIRFGRVFQTVVRTQEPREGRRNIRLVVLPTDGSVKNLELLVNTQNGASDQPVDLAIIQNGSVLPEGKDEAATYVRSVSALFPETFHVIVRKSMRVSGVTDLVRCRIPADRPGSGSEAVFLDFVKHVGLEWPESL